MAVVVLVLLSNNTFSIFSFEFGFLPYGESTNQITDLKLIGKTNHRTENTIPMFDLEFTSKYWGIIQRDQPERFFDKIFNFPLRETAVFGGSDLEFVLANPRGGGSERPNPFTFVILTSTEDFSEKDFKVKFISKPDGESGSTHKFFGESLVEIRLTGDSGEVLATHHRFERVNNPSDSNIIISPSVIDSKVRIFVDGEKIKEIDYSGKYKIEVTMGVACGSRGQTRPSCGSRLTMSQPSFKQQFGCTKEPGEQFYVSIFNEGSRVNLKKLDNFKKFCLDEAPLKIYTNVGSTTEVSPLGDLVNGEEFLVPEGQIWSIEYIGDLTSFVTECEEDELFNINEDICLARTVVTLNCQQDFEFDFDRGICVVETLPTIYNLPGIETHQELQEGSQFRFTHIFQGSEQKTPTSFSIFQDSFFSNGVVYGGIQPGTLTFPGDDESKWFVSFSFAGQFYQGTINNEFELNDILSIKIADFAGFRDDDTMTVEDFKVEYTFSIDVNFLDLTYEDNKITVSNTFQSTEGGIVVTKTDNIGTTTIEKIDKTLILGNAVFDINTDNLVELKVRPFIKLDTPQFNYEFDATNAITVNEFDSGDTIITPPKKPFDFTILGIILIGGLIVFSILKFNLFGKKK